MEIWKNRNSEKGKFKKKGYLEQWKSVKMDIGKKKIGHKEKGYQGKWI